MPGWSPHVPVCHRPSCPTARLTIPAPAILRRITHHPGSHRIENDISVSRKSWNNEKIATPSLAALLALGLTAHGTVIYSESFPTTNPTAPVGNKAFADYGWSAYQNNGTNRSTSSGDPVKVQTGPSLNGYGMLGNTGIYDSSALVSSAGSIDPAAHVGYLQLNLLQSASAGGSGAGMGWRFPVQVGSTIYASDFYSYTTAATTISATVADAIWHVWTGETDLSNGFNKSDIAPAAGNLPAGVISNIVVLAIDATGTASDRLNLLDFEITDNGIPKPTTRTSPVVIFKLDDLTDSSATELNAFSAPWNRLFDYSATKPLIIPVGIIGNSLAPPLFHLRDKHPPDP